jgi:hypothetical protein
LRSSLEKEMEIESESEEEENVLEWKWDWEERKVDFHLEKHRSLELNAIFSDLSSERE